MNEAPKYLTVKEVKEHWGPEFEALAKNSRLHFLESEIIIDLSRPVTTDEGEVNQLRFHEPLGADMMASDEGGDGAMSRTIYLLKSCTGVPLVSLRSMRAKDITLAGQVANAFL